MEQLNTIQFISGWVNYGELLENKEHNRLTLLKRARTASSESMSSRSVK